VGDAGGVGSPGVGGALVSVELPGVVGVDGVVEVVGVALVVVVVVAGPCRCTSVRGAQV
jgi:hypothetical protein